MSGFMNSHQSYVAFGSYVGSGAGIKGVMRLVVTQCSLCRLCCGPSDLWRKRTHVDAQRKCVQLRLLRVVLPGPICAVCVWVVSGPVDEPYDLPHTFCLALAFIQNSRLSD